MDNDGKCICDDPLKTPNEEGECVCIDSLITNYGGLENIKGVEIENSRLKIEVDDLDIVNLESIKSNTTAGVFVTGNTVKTLYKLSSEEIKRSLDQRLKEK